MVRPVACALFVAVATADHGAVESGAIVCTACEDVANVALKAGDAKCAAVCAAAAAATGPFAVVVAAACGKICSVVEDDICRKVAPGADCAEKICEKVDLCPAPKGSDSERFSEFVTAMGRTYSSVEEEKERFEIFVKNLEHLAKIKALDPGATYSEISPFGDMTPEEFNARNTLKAHQFRREEMVEAALFNAANIPDSIDWVEKGAVNAVKNQGQCGSCWSFSTIANIEAVNFLKTGKLVSLSEEQLVDCDKSYPSKTQGDQGCQGGLPANAMGWLSTEHIGLEYESKYPYVGRDGKTCAATKSDEAVFISSFLVIKPDEDQMAAALVQHGPLSIGLNAGPMQFYMGGISDPLTIVCDPKSIDHAVNIVGYGNGTRLLVEKNVKYWKIRNSWGESWGEKGYYRIVRGVNKCGLNSLVTTAVMGSATVIV